MMFFILKERFSNRMKFIYLDNIPCLFFYFTDDSLLQVFTFFHSTARKFPISLYILDC
ncbi:hypothetical protein SALBM311S_03735 [Streptomyces alboniger]